MSQAGAVHDLLLWEGLLAPWDTSCTSLLLLGLESEEDTPYLLVLTHAFWTIRDKITAGLSAPQPRALGVVLLL